jgi:hypothetical protein
VEVRVDKDVLRGAAAHGAPRLAHLERGLQQPPGKRAPQLFPFGGQVIAPLLCPRGHVQKFLPLRPAVGNEAQLSHQPAPHLTGGVHRLCPERPAGIQALKEH